LAIEDYIDAQIAQGKADIKAGRIVDAKEALDRLREKLK
jgi:predicted transcriptional regulator